MRRHIKACQRFLVCRTNEQTNNNMKFSATLLVVFALCFAIVVVDAQSNQQAKRSGHANMYKLHESILHEQEQTQIGISMEAITPLWFNQTLDHFSNNTATYQQRYFFNGTFFKPGGPIFLYIGGEGGLSGGEIVYGEIVDRAKDLNGALFSLEHRYYGLSQPFANWSTDNLRYLSSQQALSDLSAFIQAKRSEGWNGTWFVFGGSYPGALSAWFRLKYPHLTIGSVASSAPVFAKTDFFEYDQYVGITAGPDCAHAIRAANDAVQQLVFESAESNHLVKSKFGCELLTDDVGFLYVLADAVSFAIQYNSQRQGSPTYNLKNELCSDMLPLPSNTTVLIENYAKFVNSLFGKLGSTCLSFTSIDITLSNITVDESQNQRQWYYQSCREFGFFQTAPANNSVRSPLINLTYHLDLCARVFGEVIVPNTTFTNEYYGGRSPVNASNIFFVNGDGDPWHALSIISPIPNNTDVQVRLIAGTSHCADLSSASSSDPADLTLARKQIADYVTFWITGKFPPPSDDSKLKNITWPVVITAACLVFVGFTCYCVYARMKRSASAEANQSTNYSKLDA